VKKIGLLYALVLTSGFSCKKTTSLSTLQDVAYTLNQNDVRDTVLPSEIREENGTWVRKLDYNTDGSLLYQGLDSVDPQQEQLWKAHQARQAGFTAAVNDMRTHSQGGGFAWDPAAIRKQEGFKDFGTGTSMVPPAYLRSNGVTYRFDATTKRYVPAPADTRLDLAQQKDMNAALGKYGAGAAPQGVNNSGEYSTSYLQYGQGGSYAQYGQGGSSYAQYGQGGSSYAQYGQGGSSYSQYGQGDYGSDGYSNPR
jgi:hypothetical protein